MDDSWESASLFLWGKAGIPDPDLPEEPSIFQDPCYIVLFSWAQADWYLTVAAMMMIVAVVVPEIALLSCDTFEVHGSAVPSPS